MMEPWQRTTFPRKAVLETAEPQETRPASGRSGAPPRTGYSPASAPASPITSAPTYLGTDVTATRVGLAAVAVLAHVAIPVYVAGWALIPEEGKSRSRAAEFLDSVTTRVRQA
jgi:PspC domain